MSKNGGGGKHWKINPDMRDFPYDVVKPTVLSLAKNDEIKFKIQDQNTQIKRNDTARVLSIDRQYIKVLMGDGRTQSFKRSADAAKGMVHNYASTNFAAQGQSHENAAGHDVKSRFIDAGKFLCRGEPRQTISPHFHR